MQKSLSVDLLVFLCPTGVVHLTRDLILFKTTVSSIYFFLWILDKYHHGIVVRAHASHAKGLRFESGLEAWLNTRSMFTQQRMGTWWQNWGDKSDEPPNLTCRWPGISVLSNRHSLTYESIRGYLCHRKRHWLCSVTETQFLFKIDCF